MGRPRKPRGTAKSEVLRVRCTASECDAAYACALSRNSSLAELLRDVLLKTIRAGPEQR
jgi:hypothetical protein